MHVRADGLEEFPCEVWKRMLMHTAAATMATHVADAVKHSAQTRRMRPRKILHVCGRYSDVHFAASV